MSVSTTIDQGPSLFDPKPESKPEPARDTASESAAQPVAAPQSEPAAQPPAEASAAAPEPASTAQATVSEQTEAQSTPSDDKLDRKAESGVDDPAPLAAAETAAAEQDEPLAGEGPRVDRKRLAEQLDALRRKEAELMRALAVNDHPELADAIRSIEARVYCVTRAESKLAQGLSKSEARRQETITKKLASLREKRAELDAQIETLEAEHQELGAARMADFQKERQDALRDLMVALAQHDAALHTSGLDVQALLPELAPLMPELEAIARSVSEPHASA